tara:strand:- start:2013 stop:2891 length:879 start_codon:yes stop_codon:yes gene_type:complete
MNTYLDSSCKLCGLRNIRKYISSKDFRLKSSIDDHSLLNCNDCNFIFLNYKNAQGYLYSESFFLKIDFLTKINYFFWKKNIKSIKKKYFDNKKINILDYGCGSGGLVKYLSKDFNIDGYDPFKQFSDNQKNFYHSIDSIDNKKYNLIILSHVIEHIVDLDLEIKALANLLDNNGIIIFEIPNIKSLEYNLYKKYFFHLDLPRHLNFFNKDNISIFFKKKKFTKLSINNGFTLVLAPFSPIKSTLFKLKNENVSIFKKIIILFCLPFLFFFFLFLNIFKINNSYFGGIYQLND